MVTPEFEYHRPNSIVEACQLGLTFGSESYFLAGGTELLVDLKERRYSAGNIIALGGIPDLDRIYIEGGFLHIGAMATLSEIARSERIHKACPVLSEASSTIGSEQIRNRGTIGGNFCGAVPCADTPPVCIAAGALLRIAGISGERSLSAADFFIAPRESALKPGEILVKMQIPVLYGISGASYQRFSLRHGSSLAVAAVAAWLVLKENWIVNARIVLGAVAPIPLPVYDCTDLLINNHPSDELFQEAASVVAKTAKPITDIRGSDVFRRNLVEVLTIRALREATVRAGGRLL